MGARILNYIKESRDEMKKVNWPTRHQTMTFTVVVIAVSLGVAVFLGSLDLLFQSLLRIFVL